MNVVALLVAATAAGGFGALASLVVVDALGVRYNFTLTGRGKYLTAMVGVLFGLGALTVMAHANVVCDLRTMHPHICTVLWR